MRRLVKILKITLLILSGLFALVTGFVMINEDSLKQKAIGYLNQYLDAPVNVQDIELTIWKRFPSVSLNFKEVLIPDLRSTPSDTLIYAKNIHLELNISELLNETYSAHKVHMNEAYINLVVDGTGEENYIFWKTPNDTISSESAFQLDLKDIVFENSRIRYRNFLSHQDYYFFFDQLGFSGNFNDDQFNLLIRSDFLVEHFQSKNLRLIHQKRAQLATQLMINTTQNHYEVTQGILRLEDLLFDISGKVVDHEKATLCDLHLTGKKINIQSLFSVFSEKLFTSIAAYDSKGVLDFKTAITGEVSKEQGPVIEAEFNVANGSLTDPSTNIALDKIQLKGRFSNFHKKKHEYLNIESFSATLADGKFSGSVSLEDFEQPVLKTHLRGNIDLHTLQGFFKFKNIEQIKGRIALDSRFTGKLKDPQHITPYTLSIWSSSGKVSFKNAFLKLKGNAHVFEEIRGDFLLKNKNAAVRNMHCKIGSSDLLANGYCNNFLNYVLFPNQKLKIVADINSNFVDLLDIIGTGGSTTKQSSKREKYDLKFPDNINFNFDLGIKKLNYDRLKAQDLTCNLRLINKKLYADQLHFKNSGGTIDGQLMIDGSSGDQLIVTANTDLKKLEVRSLLHQFHNFGQSSLTEKELSGQFSSTTQLACVLNAFLEFDQDKLYCKSTIDLEKGRIENWKMMTDIVSYIRNEKALMVLLKNDINDLEKKLINIQFDKLHNVIEIKNRKINIPSISIQSNAMDITAGGWHAFNNDIDYRFDFRFRDLKKKDAYNEFGHELDDGLGFKIYLRMFGNLENPKFERDKETAKEIRQQKVEEEKETFKSILKNEFGLFNKDSTVKELPKENRAKEELFLQEEEEEPDHTFLDDKKKTKKKKNKGRVSKFLDKLKEESEKEQKESSTTFEIEEN